MTRNHLNLGLHPSRSESAHHPSRSLNHGKEKVVPDLLITPDIGSMAKSNTTFQDRQYNHARIEGSPSPDSPIAQICCQRHGVLAADCFSQYGTHISDRNIIFLGILNHDSHNGKAPEIDRRRQAVNSERVNFAHPSSHSATLLAALLL